MSRFAGGTNAVRVRMREIANERRRFGYRRLAILLRHEGKGINLKKVYRLYREKRLTVRKRGGRKRALGTRAPMAISQESSQRWSLDNALGLVGLRPAVPYAWASSTITVGDAWPESSTPCCRVDGLFASWAPSPSVTGCRA